MTLLTYIALTGSLIALAIGFTTILGETGYRFDLRRRRRERRRGSRVGGRREEDLAHVAE